MGLSTPNLIYMYYKYVDLHLFDTLFHKGFRERVTKQKYEQEDLRIELILEWLKYEK